MGARARLLFLVKAAISVGLLVWLGVIIAEREGMNALLARLGSLAPVAVIVAIGIHFVAVIAGVARWRVLLDARGLGQPFPWLVRSFLIGRFVGAFTPSTAGLDGWRAFEVARKSGDAAGSAGVIVVEKLIGLVGMAIVCAAVTPLGGLERLGPTALPIALAIAAGSAVGLWVLAAPARAKALASVAPAKVRPRLEKIAEALASGGLRPAKLALAVGLGIVTHLALSSVFVATGAALGADVAPAAMLAIGNAIVIAVLLPISVGGVGVREGVAVALLAGAGVPASEAALIATLGWLTGQVPALIGGMLLLIDRSSPRGTGSPSPSPDESG
jgi:uncharacterized membrane protein YbhN (UPF0104 family)